MKSLFTLLFLACFTFVNAQDLSITPSEIQLDGQGEYIDYGTTVLTNNGSSTLELAVTLEPVCYDGSDETEISICIDQACFLPANETTTWGMTGASLLILEPGESSDVLKFTSSGEIYGSEWNVVFFDRTNESNSTTLSVKIDDCDGTPILSSTNDFEYSIEKAFPNPATDVINIAYEIDVNEANLNIYNAMGMLVETVTVSPQANTVSVDVIDYVNGVYFYNVTDGKAQSKMMSFVK